MRNSRRGADKQEQKQGRNEKQNQNDAVEAQRIDDSRVVKAHGQRCVAHEERNIARVCSVPGDVAPNSKPV